MSLQVLAQDMASRGRGPDTMLVHMAPKEVYGLQALARAHGGSLSINPQTGLPEAGFLSSLLPMLIGAGLTAATGGAAAPGLFGLSNAATIGLGVGGLQALRTGSLAKGLMAGLGAYGGAGLMGSVMGAGTGAVSAGAGAAPDFSSMGYDTAAFPAPVTTAAPVAAAPVAAAPIDFSSMGYDTAAFPAPPAPMMDPNIVSGATQERLLADRLATTTPTQVAKAGFGEVFKDPSKFLTKDNLKYGLAAAAPGIASLMAPKTAAQAPVDSEQYRYAYDPGRLTPPTRMGDVGEYTYFRPSYTRLAAEGGTMTSDYTYDPKTMLYSRVEPVKPKNEKSVSGDAGPYMMGGPDAIANPNPFADPNSITNGLVAALFGGQNPAPVTIATPTTINEGPAAGPAGAAAGETGISAATEAAGSGPSTAGEGVTGEKRGGIIRRAAGGISHLGDYSDGGRLLRGPGDGVSDSIPATIANKRPARLADGEFVVPARIVSELGNGSTEAGARKLYAMMDRIQKNRTKSVGKGKVAVNSRSEQLLPA